MSLAAFTPAARLHSTAALCNEYVDLCLQCALQCLRMGANSSQVDHDTLRDHCESLCDTPTVFVGIPAPHQARTCRECADICAACADDCDRLACRNADGHTDYILAQCARACRRCADFCRQLSIAA